MQACDFAGIKYAYYMNIRASLYRFNKKIRWGVNNPSVEKSCGHSFNICMSKSRSFLDFTESGKNLCGHRKIVADWHHAKYLPRLHTQFLHFHRKIWYIFHFFSNINHIKYANSISLHKHHHQRTYVIQRSQCHHCKIEGKKWHVQGNFIECL